MKLLITQGTVVDPAGGLKGKMDILIEDGQVFVIDYHTREGKIDRKYYIADGTVWQNMICTRRVEMIA